MGGGPRGRPRGAIPIPIPIPIGGLACGIFRIGAIPIPGIPRGAMPIPGICAIIPTGKGKTKVEHRNTNDKKKKNKQSKNVRLASSGQYCIGRTKNKTIESSALGLSKDTVLLLNIPSVPAFSICFSCSLNVGCAQLLSPVLEFTKYGLPHICIRIYRKNR